MYDDLIKRLRSQCRGYGIECEDCNADGNCRSQMENEAADAIEERCQQVDKFAEEAARLYAKLPRWISVEERLPELRQKVLVSDGKWSGEGWLDRYDWHDPNREDVVYTSPQPIDFWCIPGCKVDEDHVTHWQPLPEPPKEG